MTEYPEPLQDLLEVFESVVDPMERANLLIDFADRFREVPPDIASRPFPPEHLVPFCESEAYVWATRQNDGTVALHFAVDNPSGISAKALAAVLQQTLSGLPAAEVERVSPDIVPQIFRQNISMGKGMGLTAMVQTVKALARRLREQRA
jgi:cysteine desulfuration protein SufE